MFRQFITTNSLEDGLFAVLAAVAFMLVFQLLRWLLLLHLQRVTKTTGSTIGNFFIEVLSATRIFLVTGVGLYVAALFLKFPVALEKFVDHAFIALIILQLGFWANRGLVFWLRCSCSTTWGST